MRVGRRLARAPGFAGDRRRHIEGQAGMFAFETLISLGLLTVVGLLLALLLRQGQRDGGEAIRLLQQQVDALRAQIADSLAQGSQATNQQLARLAQQVSVQLDGVTRTVGDRLDSASRAVADVREGLGRVSQATQRVLEVGQDIASLQDILRAPKFRGALGELLLSNLLSEMLPSDHYQLQHRFSSGETVDAVIRLGERMVPVDAKFPVENLVRALSLEEGSERASALRRFAADVRKHVDDIAAKYILPDEGTYDFALMYVPAENVYYQIICSPGEGGAVCGYAAGKRVFPVSPNSFYAYLQAIALGLRGMRVERSAQEILAHLSQVQGDLGRFRGEFEVLGRHLTNAQGKYQEADRRLLRLEDRLGQLPAGDGTGPEALS